jgi:hypothetical protein
VREMGVALFDAGGIFFPFLSKHLLKLCYRSIYATFEIRLSSPTSFSAATCLETVNMHGCPGKSVSCDLHMEHNGEAKKQLSGLGSNITDAAVTRVGNALGEVVQILHQFDDIGGIKDPSARHSKKSCDRDVSILIKELRETSKVFHKVSGRAHQTFPTFKQNCMNSLTLPTLSKWIQEQLHKHMTYH